MKKGIVISLDALIALTILFSMILIATAYMSQVSFEAKNSLILRENNLDIATVLEKNGEFENAVNTDKVNSLRSYINKLPNSLCVEIEIFNESDLNTSIMSVLRGGCKKSTSDSATVNRSFLVETNNDVNFFIARTRAWFRVT